MLEPVGFWMEAPYSGPYDPRYWDDDDRQTDEDDEFATGCGHEPCDIEREMRSFGDN